MGTLSQQGITVLARGHQGPGPLLLGVTLGGRSPRSLALSREPLAGMGSRQWLGVAPGPQVQAELWAHSFLWTWVLTPAARVLGG